MNDKKEETTKEIPPVLALVGAGLLIAFAFFYPTLFPGEKTEEVRAVAPQYITYPEYVQNPSAYLVDWNDEIESTIPTTHRMWVEDVIDGRTLLVSYVVIRAGVQILDFGHIRIPGITYSDEKCRNDEAFSFLRTDVFHKGVFLVREDEGYKLVVEIPGTNQAEDVAARLVRNGYGVATNVGYQSIVLSSGEKWEKKWGNLQYFQYEISAIQELKEMEDVARLAKRGIWATCKI